MYKRITGNDYSIKPCDINAKKHFFGAFDHEGTEIAANWIVRLCQEQGTWGPFRQQQLDEFYRRKWKGEAFLFNRLIEPGRSYNLREGVQERGGGWIEKEGDTFYVTDDFIARCLKASPRFSKNDHNNG